MMLENTINMGAQYLHSSLDIQPHHGEVATNSTRDKVFPTFIHPPPSLVNNPTAPRHALRRERRTGIDDTSPFQREESAVADEEISVPVRTPIVVGNGDAAAEEPVARTLSPPTAEDFANLFFCESSEEEETRAHLSPPAESSRDNNGNGAFAARSTSATSMTTTTAAMRRRRRVSFGASIPTVHLLYDTPTSRDMTPDERTASWFGRRDLELLKCSAHRAVREMRDRMRTAYKSGDGGGRGIGGRVVADRRSFRVAMTIMENETGHSVRGLEHRVFRRRHARRSAVRGVLECQTHAKGLARFGHVMGEEERAELLAHATRERSSAARRVAFTNARYDCEEVYGRREGGVVTGVEGNACVRTCKRQKKHSMMVDLQGGAQTPEEVF